MIGVGDAEATSSIITDTLKKFNDGYVNFSGTMAAAIFFFFSCTFVGIRHRMVMGGGFPSAILQSSRRFTMNNCLCNIFDNNNWIWILIIVLLLTSCCC